MQFYGKVSVEATLRDTLSGRTFQPVSKIIPQIASAIEPTVREVLSGKVPLPGMNAAVLPTLAQRALSTVLLSTGSGRRPARASM